jgi:hypothetical protein
MPVILSPFWCETRVRACGPDHSSRETPHPESKLLKKYESKPHKRPLQAAAKPAAGRPGHRDIVRIALKSLHIRDERQKAAARRVYLPLTIFGKDCGHISKKRQQRVHGPANADS